MAPHDDCIYKHWPSDINRNRNGSLQLESSSKTTCRRKCTPGTPRAAAPPGAPAVARLAPAPEAAAPTVAAGVPSTLPNRTKLRVHSKVDHERGATVVSLTEPLGGLREFGGSDWPEFNRALVKATLATVPPTDADGMDLRIAAACAALAAFAPKDEIEAMVAAQAVALHQATMECLRRAMLAGQSFEVASKLRKDGANLARSMTDMLHALDCKRGKTQVVRVERVVVNDGGQAIVGTVAGAASCRDRGEG
jgi:hypothetical protein